MRKREGGIRSSPALAAVVIAVAVVGIIVPSALYPVSTAALVTEDGRSEPKAPMAASQDGNNVYVVWWTNRTGNWEVMFRASNDEGQTFGDKINLSNSPDTQSQTAEILAVGNRVYVTWWELNENVHPHTNESVMRVSTDAGRTFGPVMNLGTNGTLTTTTTSGNTTTTTTSAAG
jgi:hypothetical protein